MTASQKVVVIGHKNPDTDSICSAIAYAELKNKLGEYECEARRAGKLNPESAFVLKRFGFPIPRLCTDVNPKVRNVEYRQIDGISPDATLRTGWTTIRDNNIDTLAVTDAERNLIGVLSVKDIAVANMDVFDTTMLAKSHTPYRNILETLKGTMVTGSAESIVAENAKVLVGAASPEVLENTVKPGDVVILSNRYESQLCAIELQAGLVIVCQSPSIGKTIVKLAEENGVAIMSVPCDTYAAGKLISQCIPVSFCMTTENLRKFTLVTPIDDVKAVMSRTRHSYFPILDDEGKYCGMLSRRNVLNLERRRIILVDHNEKTQAVDGFENSDILEIIDHHRIGTLETSGPVYFRNQPIGSTASIVTQAYEESGVEITTPIAGLLLSAILSDTLKLTSPTCTPLDKKLAEKLAAISGVNIDEYAHEMFSASEAIEGKSAEEILMQDFKVFMCGDIRFGVAQSNFINESNIEATRKLIAPQLSNMLLKQNLEDIYVMLTSIEKTECTLLCAGSRAKNVASLATGQEFGRDECLHLPGVVSRKKQLVPALMDAYQSR